VKSIEGQNGNLKEWDERWRDYTMQEEWEAMRRRHEQRMQKLDAVRQEMERFGQLVVDANMEAKRSEILLWLQVALPATHFDAAVAKRRNYATGQWLLQSSQFSAWKKTANSFLWLIGKGKVYHPTWHMIMPRLTLLTSKPVLGSRC
jgi:hypothetical protein